GLSLNPIEQSIDVPIRLIPQGTIVERQKCLSVSRGSADVRRDHGYAEFVHVVIPAAGEAWPELAFGAAVNVDSHGTLARELRGWPVEKATDRASIPGFPVNQFGFRKVRCVDTAG